MPQVQIATATKARDLLVRHDFLVIKEHSDNSTPKPLRTKVRLREISIHGVKNPALNLRLGCCLRKPVKKLRRINGTARAQAMN